MSVTYVITPELDSKFKEPFGTLIQGSFFETMSQFKEIVARENPAMIISVGDTVSRNLHQHRVIPHLSIVDYQSMRRKIPKQRFPDKNIIEVKNPKGTITEEAIGAIKEGVQSSKQIQIVVDGEEDLLTLVAVLYAPENALVVYGQPHKGIVVVKATQEKKVAAQRFLKEMKTAKEDKQV